MIRDSHFNLYYLYSSTIGYISYVKYNPQITLTQKGANVDLATFDVQTEVRDKAHIYWEECAAKNRAKNKRLRHRI